MEDKKELFISAIILTRDEQHNLPACLESIKNYVDEIIIVDSFSTDSTIEIASKYTNKIYQHKFINQAQQFKWALNNIDIANEWILRVDADERWTTEGFAELREIIDHDLADGVSVKMKMYFMHRWIKHGDFYPNFFLRVFKRSKGTIEDRLMDEHINVTGRTIMSNIDVIENNYDRQNNITGWITKHNNYATREAIEFLSIKYQLRSIETIANLVGGKTERKRWLKENLYYKLPLFARAFLFFLYRYFIKLGFLDGREGFIYLLLQGFWYRFLVDTKIYQLEKIAHNERRDIRDVIMEHYGMEL
jgi:glycosyltransferase involved in cell wall biosynthesis